MSAEPQPAASLELVRREASEALERPLPPMNDAEVSAAYRTAKALADSGMFKDARQPGQAFAKMLAGRDLGLTPFESMSALHVIEGKIEAGADLHATRVRQREGYDYRVSWLKIVPPAEGQAQTDPPRVEAVWADEEDPADLRDTYGCVVVFTIDGKRRGLARWTHADTVRAGLATKDNHRKYPRSMHFARAMSQGVALLVPEVMGGLRVYSPGELPREGGPDLGAGEADTAPAMDTLPTAVEAVLARARELGHAGLANREAAATATAGQPPERVGQWVTRATRVLNRFAAGHEPEPPEAEVVPASDSATSNEGAESEQAQNKAVSRDESGEVPAPMGEARAAQDAQPQPAERDESGEEVDAEPVAADPDRAEGLRAVAAQLLEDADAAEAEGNPDEAERLRESAGETIAEADALGDPSQPGFEF